MVTLSVRQITQACLGKTGNLSVNSDVYGYVFRDTDGSVSGTLTGTDTLPGTGQPTTRSLRRHLGTISGLGDRRPAVVLDRADRGPRRQVAVVGKAWCLADAEEAPIEVGDLLTTSGRPGHAMAAREPGAAFGAIIGKALTPLAGGCGTVLVLVGLS